MNIKTILFGATSSVLLLSGTHAFAGSANLWKGRSNIIANYANYYQGDDDLVSRCLLLADGARILIFEQVGIPGIVTSKVKSSDLQKLEQLRQNIPAESSDKTSLATVDPNDDYGQIQVLGSQGYYKVSDKTELSTLVNRMCDITENAVGGQAPFKK